MGRDQAALSAFVGLGPFAGVMALTINTGGGQTATLQFTLYVVPHSADG